MSIEQDIQALTGAINTLNANILQLLGGEAKAPAPEPQPKAKKVKPAITPEEAMDKLLEPTKGEVIAALKALQEAAGSSGVQALLSEHGVRNVGALPADLYSRVIEQATSLARTMEKAA